jgi:hypothetical protein
MPKKKPEDWTTEEALRRLFPKPVAETLRRAAHGALPGTKRPVDRPSKKPRFPGKSPDLP